jgi:NAD(P)-dependent dehydrogenase (short-subunit alcohol dehydrogenase family)
MKRTAFVTGADRGLGFALSEGLLRGGWEVFAGQHRPAWPQLAGLAAEWPRSCHVVPVEICSTESVQSAARAVAEMTDHVDLLINNAGIAITFGAESLDCLDYGAMQRVYDVNALGALRVVHAFLPLTDAGMRRLAFVSSEAGSISLAHRQSGFGYSMSKSALNMAVKITFNRLRPDGYTFRLYHPGWVRSYMSGHKMTEADLEPEEAAAMAIPFFVGDRDDEDRLVLIDNGGLEWPF